MRARVLLILLLTAHLTSWCQSAVELPDTLHAAPAVAEGVARTVAAATDSLLPAVEAPVLAPLSPEDLAQREAIERLEAPADTAALGAATLPLNTTKGKGKALPTGTDTHQLRAKRQHKIFVPDPQRALWLSFVIPGGGQIYNRKYWKLPIFYGGFLGCMYAFTWNQQMYLDYSQAYLDIMDDNPNTQSYLQMFPPSYDIESNVGRFQSIFKNRKDRFRRWRDLSTFCFIGVYALSIIDAYVDAHLSVFDISPDLSFQWGPTSIEGPHANIGLSAALSF